METGGSLIYALGAMALVVSALAARRLSFGESAKMILAWVAIFGVLFVIFSFRPEIKQIWERVTSDIAGTANQNVVGQNVQLTRGDDGHFSVQARVNGNPVTFLVDSGATVTSLSSETAAPVIVSTANGNAKAWRARIGEMKIETISVSDHPVSISDNLGDTNLLGMNFLDELSSWSVQGDVMTLEP